MEQKVKEMMKKFICAMADTLTSFIVDIVLDEDEKVWVAWKLIHSVSLLEVVYLAGAKIGKGSHHKKNGKIWEKFPNRLDPPPPPIGNFRLFSISDIFEKLRPPPRFSMFPN